MEQQFQPTQIRRRRLLAVLGIVGIAGIGVVWRRAIAPARSATEDDVAIAIQDFAFMPAVLTVKPGTTVVWTNRDDEPHTVTDVGQQFKSPALDTDDSYRHRFDTLGTFTYVCSLHPHMTGTITVGE